MMNNFLKYIYNIIVAPSCVKQLTKTNSNQVEWTTLTTSNFLIFNARPSSI